MQQVIAMKSDINQICRKKITTNETAGRATSLPMHRRCRHNAVTNHEVLLKIKHLRHCYVPIFETIRRTPLSLPKLLDTPTFFRYRRAYARSTATDITAHPSAHAWHGKRFDSIC